MKRRVVKGSGEDKALNQEGDGGRKQQGGEEGCGGWDGGEGERDYTRTCKGSGEDAQFELSISCIRRGLSGPPCCFLPPSPS